MKPTLDQVFVYSPLVILWGFASEEHPVEFVTGNIERLGFSAREIMSGKRSFYSLIHEEDVGNFKRLFSDALLGEIEEIRAEYRLVRSDGECVWVEDRTRFHRDEDGGFFTYQSSLSDITERKRSEMLLRLNNERLAQVLEASKICVWEYDPESGSLHPPGDRDLFRSTAAPEGLKKSLAKLLNGEAQSVEHSGESPDMCTESDWSVSKAYLVYDEYGKISHVSGLSIDVSELQRTERRVALQNERLELIQSMFLAFMEETDTDRLLGYILEKAMELARTEHGRIALLEPDGKDYRVVLGRGVMKSFEGNLCSIESGLAGEVFRTKNKVVIKDYRTYEKGVDDPRLARCSTVIGLPLFRGDVFYGFISVVYQDVPREVDNDFLFDLELFAGAASIALENARLHGDARRTLEERVRASGRLNDHIRLVDTISRASSLLLSHDEETGVLERSLDLTASAFDACKASLFRIETLEDGGMSVCLIGTSVSEGTRGAVLRTPVWLSWDKVFDTFLLPLLDGEIFQGPVPGPWRQGECLQDNVLFNEEHRPAPQLMAVPVNLHNRLWGFLALIFREHRFAFPPDELDALRGAAYTMAASESRWELEREAKAGYERLQKAFTDVVRTMGRIVGKKDPFTIKHQERVSILATAIGEKMYLDEVRCEGLRIAGLVHDVGKIEIAGEILNKPGRLSDVEFELVKTHPRSSYEILRGIDFPWPVAEIALQHHERVDGSGYPGGLKGTDILLEARILAVADVVEAMASHRPYRPAPGVQEAIEEICSKRNSLYDPEVVDACLSVLDERPEILADD